MKANSVNAISAGSRRIIRSGSAETSVPEEPASSGSGSCLLLYRREVESPEWRRRHLGLSLQPRARRYGGIRPRAAAGGQGTGVVRSIVFRVAAVPDLYPHAERENCEVRRKPWVSSTEKLHSLLVAMAALAL